MTASVAKHSLAGSLQDLSCDQLDALLWYMSSGHFAINTLLRHPGGIPERLLPHVADELDRARAAIDAFDAMPLMSFGQDTIVHRATYTDFAPQLGILDDPAYLSCTLEPELMKRLAEWDWEEPVRLNRTWWRITVPAGTGVLPAYAWASKCSRHEHLVDTAAEVILPRSLAVTVSHIEQLSGNRFLVDATAALT